MTRRYAVAGIAVALAMLSAAPGRAQRAGPPAAPMFDTTTVETITGTVLRVDTVAAPPGMRRARAGVHVELRAGTDTVPVHLGPTWYMQRQSTRLAVGDRITVRGSRVTWQGKPAVVAAEVRKGGAVLTLRDRNGRPRWNARGP